MTATPAATLARLLARPEPVTWLFTGDSVTHGALHTYGHRDYVELFAERVRWELGRTRDAILTTAVSGRRIGDLLDDLDWSVDRYRPDVVSVMFGLNDCRDGAAGVAEFRRHYRQLLTEIARRTSALVLLHTPNGVLATDAQRTADLPPYVAAIRTIAGEFGLLLVDQHAEWEQAERVHAWMADGCHPGQYGHRALARTLLRTCGIWDPDSPSGRLLIP